MSSFSICSVLTRTCCAAEFDAIIAAEWPRHRSGRPMSRNAYVRRSAMSSSQRSEDTPEGDDT